MKCPKGVQLTLAVPALPINPGLDLLITHLKLLQQDDTTYDKKLLSNSFSDSFLAVTGYNFAHLSMSLLQMQHCGTHLPGETPLPPVHALFTPLLQQLPVYISLKIKLCAVNYQAIYFLIEKPSLRRLSSKTKSFSCYETRLYTAGL